LRRHQAGVDARNKKSDENGESVRHHALHSQTFMLHAPLTDRIVRNGAGKSVPI
jgi:hypothetical protein